MYFQEIRSATIKLTYDNVTFLIDPWLQDYSCRQEILNARQMKQFLPEPTVPLPLPVSEILKDVDYLLVTHSHPDHFTPDYLPKDMPLYFQNEEEMGMAKELGFTNTFCFYNKKIAFHGITVTRVDGKHGDHDMLADEMGMVSGFIFEAENEKTVYIAGDTVFCDIVKENIKIYKPEVIIINSCDARGSKGRILMNKEDVIEVCKCLPDSLVIASHMDAVSHAHLSRTELSGYLKTTAYGPQVLIPKDGEIIKL